MSGRETYVVRDLDKLWLEYDKQNDILYINFGYDIEDADESFMVSDDIVLRIKDGRLVSITVFEFSRKVGLQL